MSAKIWYYPDSTRAAGGGVPTVETLDFGELIGAEHAEPDDLDQVAEAISGLLTVSRVRTRLAVRLQAFRLPGTSAIVSGLWSLESHLLRGGIVAYAADSTKAWAGYASALPQRGDTVVRTGGNPWGALGSGAVAANDYVVLASRSPEGFRSRHKVSAFAQGVGLDRVTLSEPVVYSPRLPTLARHENFYPALRLADEQRGTPILTSQEDRQTHWDLDVLLVEDPYTLAQSERLNANAYTTTDVGNTRTF